MREFLVDHRLQPHAEEHEDDQSERQDADTLRGDLAGASAAC